MCIHPRKCTYNILCFVMSCDSDKTVKSIEAKTEFNSLPGVTHFPHRSRLPRSTLCGERRIALSDKFVS